MTSIPILPQTALTPAITVVDTPSSLGSTSENEKDLKTTEYMYIMDLFIFQYNAHPTSKLFILLEWINNYVGCRILVCAIFSVLFFLLII